MNTLKIDNNLLENTSLIGTNNINILKKLNDNGLKKLNISNNSFNDTSELKSLNWEEYND